MIPWRVKNFVSEYFPLFYHLVANMGLKGNSAEHWDARLANTWDDPLRNWPGKNQLIASLTQPSETILDIACGNGSILRDLKARGYRNLHGLELSAYAVRRLSADGIQMHVGKLPLIPIGDGTFDVVIASQVLEHIIRRKRFVREIGRILKPTGRAFLFVPDNCLGPISEKEHVIKYTAQSLRAFLESHFCIVTLASMSDPNHEMRVLFAHVERSRS